MKKLNLATLALLGTTVMAVPTMANANTIYDLAPNYTNGDCIFNTTCGPSAYGSTAIAAQFFSVAAPVTAVTGSFSAFDNNSSEPTSVNWSIYANAGGTPGALLSSGNSAFTSRTTIGSNFGFNMDRFGFNIGAVPLATGDYWFGVQAVSTEFSVYLGFASGANAATSFDNGATWTAGYDGYTTALATSLEGAVPEPASWALMIGGFGLTGAALRRRRTAVRVTYA